MEISERLFEPAKSSPTLADLASLSMFTCRTIKPPSVTPVSQPLSRIERLEGPNLKATRDALEMCRSNTHTVSRRVPGLMMYGCLWYGLTVSSYRIIDVTLTCYRNTLDCIYGSSIGGLGGEQE